MKKIVGIELHPGGRLHDYECDQVMLNPGEKVMVEADRGMVLGIVKTMPRHTPETETKRPLKQVTRLATQKDVERHEKKCKLEKDVYFFCQERVAARQLPMCLVAVERLFEEGKIMVYFTADGRVDFRELVKDLVKRFRTRIEMRQIGVRHQAKMFGGLGTCGRQLCCASFLDTFSPVSIRMAKEQNLSLNPSKISGMCGRLMCCLTYEYTFYEEMRKDIPKVGKRVVTKKGEGKVIRQNILKGIMTVQLDSGDDVEITPRDLIKRREPRKERRGKKK